MLLSATDPLGNTTHITSDAGGRPLTITDPRGNTTTMHYDAQGNPLGATDALGQRHEHRASTAPGTSTSFTDATGAVSQNQFDSAGRRTQSTDALGGVLAPCTTTPTATCFPSRMRSGWPPGVSYRCGQPDSGDERGGAAALA